MKNKTQDPPWPVVLGARAIIKKAILLTEECSLSSTELYTLDLRDLVLYAFGCSANITDQACRWVVNAHWASLTEAGRELAKQQALYAQYLTNIFKSGDDDLFYRV